MCLRFNSLAYSILFFSPLLKCLMLSDATRDLYVLLLINGWMGNWSLLSNSTEELVESRRSFIQEFGNKIEIKSKEKCNLWINWRLFKVFLKCLFGIFIFSSQIYASLLLLKQINFLKIINSLRILTRSDQVLRYPFFILFNCSFIHLVWSQFIGLIFQIWFEFETF